MFKNLFAKKIMALIVVVLAAVLFVACSVSAELKAGAAVVVITPEKSVFLAGNGNNRVSTSVHDDVFAHCVYLNDGAREVTIVTLDLLGFMNGDLLSVRKIMKQNGFDPGGLFVASTHSHTGPDVIGLWGPSETVSGRDPAYLKQLFGRISECAVDARAAAAPVEVGFASGSVENVCHNIRDKDAQDNTANVMPLRVPGGRVVATVVNYGCHPEVMLDSAVVSSDWPSVFYKRLSAKTGGAPVMFVNGALGGMVTPIVDKYDWPETERIGNLFTDKIEKIMDGMRWSREDRIYFDSRKITLPCANNRFMQAMFAGVFPRKVVGQKIETEIMHVKIGPAEFLSMPGDPLPKVGLKMKTLIKGDYKFLLSLGDDELGYILPKEEFDPGKYEESASLGPDTAPELYDAAKSLVEDDDKNWDGR